MNPKTIECPSCGQELQIEPQQQNVDLICGYCEAEIPSVSNCASPANSVRSWNDAYHGLRANVAAGALSLIVALAGWGPMFVSLQERIIFSYSSAAFLLAGLLAVGAVTALFFTIIQPRRVSGLQALGVFLFTAIPGIFCLLLLQKLGAMVVNAKSVYAGAATPWLLILKFYGQCWVWLQGPASFFQQLTGWILAVGLYEELTKLLPLVALLAYSRRHSINVSARAFIFLGFLSGVAFGVSEALLTYSPWASLLSANPVVFGMPFSSAAVRWFSGVPLHGVWGAADAAFLWMIGPLLHSRKWLITKFALLVLAALSIAVVHGVYNTVVGASNILGAGIAVICAYLLPQLCRFLASKHDSSNMEDVAGERTLAAYFQNRFAWVGIGVSVIVGVLALYAAAEPAGSPQAENVTQQSPPSLIPGIEWNDRRDSPEPPNSRPASPPEFTIPAITAVRCNKCEGKGQCARCGGAGFVIVNGK